MARRSPGGARASTSTPGRSSSPHACPVRPRRPSRRPRRPARPAAGRCGAGSGAARDGGSDAHLPGQLAHPHTVVHAEDLTTAAVLSGLRAGRSWIAASAAVELDVSAEASGRVAGIGERLAADGAALVRVTVAGVPGGTVTLHTEQGPAHRTTAETVEWHTDAAFVRAEVRHPDGKMAALTNPVVLR
ncbi:hypothetical protein ACL02R_23310 [Streptomyces sp. MS19]|uniref:hypothetical protein n=1 Tax=Streptomyces sp. MS19 TaxID=3385972 RepID=UPI0039A03DE8